MVVRGECALPPASTPPCLQPCITALHLHYLCCPLAAKDFSYSLCTDLCLAEQDRAGRGAGGQYKLRVGQQLQRPSSPGDPTIAA